MQAASASGATACDRPIATIARPTPTHLHHRLTYIIYSPTSPPHCVHLRGPPGPVTAHNPQHGPAERAERAGVVARLVLKPRCQGVACRI